MTPKAAQVLPYVPPGATTEDLVRRLEESGAISIASHLDAALIAQYLSNNGEMKTIRTAYEKLQQREREAVQTAESIQEMLSKITDKSSKDKGPETPKKEEKALVPVKPQRFTFPDRLQPLPAPMPMRKEHSAPSFGAIARPSAPRMGIIIPNPSDDVFEMDNSKALAKIGPDGKAHFDQKTTSEIFTEIYTKLETFVRNYCTLPFNIYSGTDTVRNVLTMAVTHTDDERKARDLLTDSEMRHFMITALIIRDVTDTVFKEGVLHSFNSPYQNEYLNAWVQSLMVAEEGILANDTTQRLKLHQGLAEVARKIQEYPGFWPFMEGAATALMNTELEHFGFLIPEQRMTAATVELKHIVSKALRLMVRCRQEPIYIAIAYYKSGIAWKFGDMVHRNPELVGKPCDESPSIHVVRSCVTPWIGQKRFEGPMVDVKTLRKAEVLLCPREGNLRRSQRPNRGYYRGGRGRQQKLLTQF